MAQRITIQISNKIATCLSELPVVCGNSDYIIDFLFDEEWNEHFVKTARFRTNGEYTDVVFEGNECPMPIISNSKVMWVGVFAGNLSTSTPAIVHCKPSILDEDGIPSAPLEDVYAQILELLNESRGSATALITINGSKLKFFVGEQAEYDALSAEQKQNLFAIISNDITKDEIYNTLETLQRDVAELKEKVDAL